MRSDPRLAFLLQLAEPRQSALRAHVDVLRLHALGLRAGALDPVTRAHCERLSGLSGCRKGGMRVVMGRLWSDGCS